MILNKEYLIARRKARAAKKAASEARKVARRANQGRRMATEKAYREANRERLDEGWRNYRKANASYYAAQRSKYVSAKKKAMPKWANLRAIELLYEEANFLTKITGVAFHIDHIVPLQSKVVCGLHCEANLRVIEGTDNIRKGNRYWPDMP